METNPFVHLFRTMDQISQEKRQSIDLTLRLVAEGPRDQRRYNAPTASEIAVLIMNNEEGTSRDIVLHTRANFQQNINEYHRSYDALHYVLLFPHSEDGWTIDASSLSGEHVTIFIVEFRMLLSITIVILQILERELFFHLLLLVAPDSMSIVRRFGKPDLFITFTCNSKWPEITNSLLAGQKANDRPDLCSRVFNMKLKELMIDLTKKIFWGKFWPLYMSLNSKSVDFLMPTFF
ncbi:hypothetical protein PHYBLDRAFT_73582 [Phycomyces blakesleeanus NRRL 1555(-)]|uniref:Helitron helicase-like domain-containing protein n=1 Tax=Phycomyces blakesleeanus (strain ATCC 8743b / DSM 1359 / FGSC 10004 / NBRC 33097 / NRRL 1555) TaxID=763407 RepID=A0A162Y3T5_PHYB8|nr:hypothetical protein PHYBLDRAFT_73582 [Phycomyces blakesleeanus NRRL 1555(-)]OAD78135.1 hypothetical protein PHYBLDRAFT_73582 [Phycomyces blakesleeanus NRRL 1555(-)]|eukprot:XP_018296175.1 hypothetical protein PHYBLDRAFT_73582 [Phycomyces blakesleeanus NRRL 1555(-)]